MLGDGINKQVLVVEDDQDIREFLREILESANCKVLLAEDGHQALEILKKNQIDVLVCDIVLPHMDGYSLLEKIRELNLKQPLKIMITGYFNFDNKQAIEKGADCFMQKPFDIYELLGKIKNAN